MSPPADPPATVPPADQTATKVGLKISLSYAAFALLWIVFSDQAVAWLIMDPGKMVLANTLKGVLFVLVTALGLFALSRHWLSKTTHDLLQEQNTIAHLARRSQAMLELAEKFTGSQISFVHFVNIDQETLELVNWSKETLARYCTAAFDSHYPIRQADIWAYALRQRAPVVFNDYASAAGKHGLPEGHARLSRLINVPVVQGGLVRMMVGGMQQGHKLHGCRYGNLATDGRRHLAHRAPAPGR